jgi:hypothetical protein
MHTSTYNINTLNLIVFNNLNLIFLTFLQPYGEFPLIIISRGFTYTTWRFVVFCQYCCESTLVMVAIATGICK